jgi:hypothetical protein
MMCPRGSICRESTHQVKTIDVAQQWFSGVTIKDLPITVQGWKSSGGRIMYWVSNNMGELIFKKG